MKPGDVKLYTSNVNPLHRDISGGRDNFDCNAHDQYSHMEANMAEITDAKCEHAQYARIAKKNFHLTDIERQQKEKVSRKQSFCWRLSCTFKIQFSRVLLWRVRIV